MTKSDELLIRSRELFAQAMEAGVESEKALRFWWWPFGPRVGPAYRKFQDLVEEHRLASLEWEAAIRQEFFDQYGYDPFDGEGDGDD